MRVECDNQFSIVGPKDKLHALWSRASKKGLLEAICPIGEWNFYDALVNWGCSNAEDVDMTIQDLSDDRAEINGKFKSYINTPLEAFEHYGERNKDVSIMLKHYGTSGYNDFWGTWTTDKGLHDYGMKKGKLYA